MKKIHIITFSKHNSKFINITPNMPTLPNDCMKLILSYFYDYDVDKLCIAHYHFIIHGYHRFRIPYENIMTIINFSLTNYHNLQYISDSVYKNMGCYNFGCTKYSIPAIISLITNNKIVCEIEYRAKPNKKKFFKSIYKKFGLLKEKKISQHCILCRKYIGARLCWHCDKELRKPLALAKPIFIYPFPKKKSCCL